jgi:hypothetical protein
MQRPVVGRAVKVVAGLTVGLHTKGGLYTNRKAR